MTKAAERALRTVLQAFLALNPASPALSNEVSYLQERGRAVMQGISSRGNPVIHIARETAISRRKEKAAEFYAEIKPLVLKMVRKNYDATRIARVLTRLRIPTPSGSKIWHRSSARIAVMRALESQHDPNE